MGGFINYAPGLDLGVQAAIPSAADLQSYQQMQQDALQDAYNTAAAAPGPVAARIAAQASSALTNYGPTTIPALSPSETPEPGGSNPIGFIQTPFGAIPNPIDVFSFGKNAVTGTGSGSASHGLGDYVSILIGAVMIAGGIFMFKSTGVIIEQVGGVARSGARAAAAVAG